MMQRVFLEGGRRAAPPRHAISVRHTVVAGLTGHVGVATDARALSGRNLAAKEATGVSPFCVLTLSSHIGRRDRIGAGKIGRVQLVHGERVRSSRTLGGVGLDSQAAVVPDRVTLGGAPCEGQIVDLPGLGPAGSDRVVVSEESTVDRVVVCSSGKGGRAGVVTNSSSSFCFRFRHRGQGILGKGHLVKHGHVGN